MKNSFTIKLVEGNFQPNEAGKVLFSLINSKINYHNLEIFSGQERSDGNVEHSQRRVDYLKTTSDDLSDYIKEAIQNQYNFEIVGNIEIILKK